MTAMNQHEKLGTELVRLLERSGKTQKALAIEWLEDWNQAHPEDPISESTIPSRLSEVLRGKEKGLRFFYESAARSATLLKLLAASDEERQAIDAEARGFLEDGGKLPVRLVIDVAGLTTTPGESADLFVALEGSFLPHPEWQRVLFLLTSAQLDALPRRFDELATVEKVQDEDGARQRANVLREAGAVVLTHRVLREPSSWIAVGREGDRFAFYPPAEVAREAMSRDGRLAARKAEHTLREAGIESVAGNLPSDAIAVRALMDVLVDEEESARASVLPGERLWAGEQLGVEACSTRAERSMWAANRVAAALKTTAENAAPARLKTEMDRAARRIVENIVLLIGTEVHVINPTAKVARAGHDGIHVHTIKRAPSALSRILDATKSWTVEDFVTDPLLTDLRHRLITAGAAADEVEHARQALLFTGALHGLPDAVEENWQPGLRKLLEAAPPAAHLEVNAPSPAERHTSALEIGQAAGDTGRSPEPAPQAANAIIGPDTSARSYSWRFQDGDYGREGGLVLPRSHDQALDENWMLDAFEASRSFSRSGRPHGAPRGWASVGHEGAVDLMQRVHPVVWRWADETLGLMWTLLREALASARIVRLPDGRHVLPLGSGWVATLRARKSAANEACRASFHARLPLEESLRNSVSAMSREPLDDLALLAPCSVPREHLLAWQLVRDEFPPLLREDLYRYRRNEVPIPFDVPRRLTLRGAGLAVDLAFSYSPFAPSIGSRAPLSVNRGVESTEAGGTDDDDDD